MFLLIDNYDSFTYNLWHYLGELGAEVEVHRNDKITVADALALKPQGIIISPGPCDPDKAGICLDLIKEAAGSVPLFGVCLGFQAIGQAFGGRVVRAPAPMHGKVSPVTHTGSEAGSETGRGMFADIPSPFDATRYHSLILDRASVPDELEITAETGAETGAVNDAGLVMGIAHREHLISGVQFHPESIASQFGHRVLRNFLRSTGLDAPDVPERSISHTVAA